MRVKVKFFAILREKIGESEVERQIPEQCKVDDLWQLLRQDYPVIRSMEMKLLYAVNGDYVERSYVLQDGDEVVFIPPVSGGV